jgi:hypothetical protein
MTKCPKCQSEHTIKLREDDKYITGKNGKARQNYAAKIYYSCGECGHEWDVSKNYVSEKKQGIPVEFDLSEWSIEITKQGESKGKQWAFVKLTQEGYFTYFGSMFGSIVQEIQEPDFDTSVPLKGILGWNKDEFNNWKMTILFN